MTNALPAVFFAPCLPCRPHHPQNIDPHLLLLIFLPTIGFSAALNQEPHLLRRNWGQARLNALKPWGLGTPRSFIHLGFAWAPRGAIDTCTRASLHLPVAVVVPSRSLTQCAPNATATCIDCCRSCSLHGQALL